MSENLQYLGFLNTPDLFLSEENPCSKKIFRIVFPKEHYAALSLKVKENLMLGKRAEYFFKEYLNQQQHTFECLHQNIQIFKNKTTLGEFDFFLKEKESQKIIHLEMVYKFYLYDPSIDGDEIQKWIGPNRNDTLDKKITKLRDKQFPLLHSPQAKEQLNKLGVFPEQTEQQLLFKAQLFIPPQYKTPTPKLVNPEAISGYHTSLKNFKQNKLESHLFYIPQKQDWFISPEHNKKWHQFNQIIDEVTHTLSLKKSVLVWIQKTEEEFEKIFITWWS